MKTEKPPKSVNLKSKAILWDGKKQLPGTLSLAPENLIFEFDDFQKSHLSLVIPVMDIETAEDYLVFGIAKNGLKITTKKGYDLFVLKCSREFRKALVTSIDNLRDT